jgi:MFS family permease
MNTASRAQVYLIFGYALLASISVGSLPPLVRDISQAFHTTAQVVSVIVGLLFFVSAFFSAIGGWVIDRAGLRRALIVSAVIEAAANGVCLAAPNIWVFGVGRLLEGVAYIGILSASSPLVMATTTGPRRVQGLALMSTAITGGLALGLLMSSLFAGTAYWRAAFAVHGILGVLLATAGLLLPTPARGSEPHRAHRPTMFAIFRQIGPWRLGIGYGLQTLVGTGVGILAPTFLSHAHHLSIGQVSQWLALFNVTNIPAGLLTGYLLSRGVVPWKLAAVVTVICMASGVTVYAPGVSTVMAFSALLLFYLCIGGNICLGTALLLHVTRSRSEGAATAGLVHQVTGLFGFASPQLFFAAYAQGTWTPFLILILGSLGLGALLMPIWNLRTLVPAAELAAAAQDGRGESPVLAEP